MNRRATSKSYAARIDRVVVALHAEPDRAWRLEELAEIAAFSPYHFHRIYRAFTGETPEETRRRLLLHRAAGELIQSAREVAQIARRAGYGSVAAFTRAFSSTYGRPPAAYRLSRGTGPHRAARRQEDATMYDVTIGTEPPRRLIGLPHKGSYQQIGRAFERLGPLAFGAGLSPSAAMVGVYYDDPQTVAEKDLRSFAALEAGAQTIAADPLEIRELPGGIAASVVHKGPYAELPQAYDFLYRAWLPKSGREPADAPPYEVYLNDPRSAAPSELLTRVVVPLKA